MSVVEVRGGWPQVFRDTITTTGRDHKFGFISKYIQIRVATSPCRVYFTEDDYTNNENYVEVPIPATTAPYGEWEGPAELRQVWLRGVGGSSSVELVAYQRRA